MSLGFAIVQGTQTGELKVMESRMDELVDQILKDELSV